MSNNLDLRTHTISSIRIQLYITHKLYNKDNIFASDHIMLIFYEVKSQTQSEISLYLVDLPLKHVWLFTD